MTDHLVDQLEEAYYDEVCSANNYREAAFRLESFFGEELAEELEADASEEFEHGSEILEVLDFVFDHHVNSTHAEDRQQYFDYVLDRHQTTDDEVSYVEDVLRAVLQAEEEALNRYQRIIELARENNYPTVRRLAERLYEDEQQHYDETESLLEQFN